MEKKMEKKEKKKNTLYSLETMALYGNTLHYLL